MGDNGKPTRRRRRRRCRRSDLQWARLDLPLDVASRCHSHKNGLHFRFWKGIIGFSLSPIDPDFCVGFNVVVILVWEAVCSDMKKEVGSGYGGILILREARIGGVGSSGGLREEASERVGGCGGLMEEGSDGGCSSGQGNFVGRRSAEC